MKTNVKNLKKSVVLFFVGTGDESLMHRGYGHLARKHRTTAVELMKIAQEKGFEIVFADKDESLLERAKKIGIDISNLIFLCKDNTRFFCRNFYDKLLENNIQPTVVFVAGHFREKCMSLALNHLLTMKFQNSNKVQYNPPKIYYLIGTASIPSKGYIKYDRHKLDEFFEKGVEPITIPEFRLVNKKGDLDNRFEASRSILREQAKLRVLEFDENMF
ncbi:MAG: hypothetical protein ABIG20_03990 [archaeon]